MRLVPTTATGRVSVIVGTYNRSRYIRESLDSLLNQTRPPDEVIVVDDGSTDETPSVVSSYRDRVTYCRKENGGKSSALNLGLARAVGDWVWFFDDDDVALPDALERFLLVLGSDASADFAYSGQIVGRNGPDGRAVGEHRVHTPDVPSQQLFHFALKEYPFRMQGMLVRRTCVIAIGGLNETYLRNQDYEFVLRLLRRCRGVPVAEPTFIWRVHEGARGPANARHTFADRDRVWLEFGAQLGREIRANLPLQDYLLHPTGAVEIAPQQMRKALLHRAGVMASKGLLPELLEDLVTVVRQNSDDLGLDREESVACWKIASYPYFQMRFLDAPIATSDRLMRIADTTLGRAIVAQVGRGMLYASRHSDRSLKDRQSMLRGALRLFLSSGVVATMRAFSWRWLGRQRVARFAKHRVGDA